MSTRPGFTLIELLIVVVIIGILAAVALPKFAATRQRAYFATMTTDLKNVQIEQESYFNTNFTYASSMAALNFTPSQGVTITFTGADGAAWAAQATHAAVTSGNGCAVFFGDAAGSSVTYPSTPGGEQTVDASTEGTPLCDTP